MREAWRLPAASADPTAVATAVATEEGDHAILGPVGEVRLSGEVGRQVTTVEVIENDSGVRARHVVASGVLEARDQGHQAHVVDIRQQFACCFAILTPRTDLEANLAKHRLRWHKAKSVATAVWPCSPHPVRPDDDQAVEPDGSHMLGVA